MIKQLAAIAIGAMAVAGFTGVAHAVPSETITPESQTIDGGATFTVTYHGCYNGPVHFEFEDSDLDVDCLLPPVDEGLQPAGFRASLHPSITFETGTATATFTAPAAGPTAELYGGVAFGSPPPQLGDAAAPQGFRAPQVVWECGESSRCVEFEVTVAAQATTTTEAATTTTEATTTTTLAPTTTVAATAPTTTAAAVIPPAPTTAPVATGVLPATGQDENNQAAIALGLVVLGGGLIVATRYRRGSSAS